MRILEVASRCFAERGYEETRVSDIAAAVEIGEATLYRYFPSKERIATEASAHLVQTPVGLAALDGPGANVLVERARRTIAGAPSLRTR
jgi:AcrR family transcriptional regulator